MRVFFKVLLCLLCVTVQSVYAQDSSAIKFKGIPVSGHISNMVEELKKQGYTLKELNNTSALLNGKFANETCDIIVYATATSKQVYSILVVFGKQSSWYSLKSEYLRIKNMVKDKYNVSPDATEKFYSPYYEGDGYEMQALSRDKCAYFSTFDIDNDKIGVYILTNKVLLNYENSANKLLDKREEDSKAYSDL